MWQRADDAAVKNLTLLALVNSADATLFGGLKTEAEELRDQRELFQDVRPTEASLDPSWLTRDVAGLAATIYETRAFDHLPVLADALEDAGWRDAAVLGHCRERVPHVRGCWALDLLLGRS